LLSNGESGPPCGVPSTLGLTSPVLHHPSIQECPDEFQQPLVFDPFGNLTHQFVVIDPIEKFLQIKIHNPAVAFCYILLCLGYRLMSRSFWSKRVAVIGKGLVPAPLQNLHYRLLNESIQHGGDTKLAYPSPIRLGDFYPSDRLRLVGPAQQLFPDGWPVLFEVVNAELLSPA